MIRISTATAFGTGVDTLGKRQRELSDAQGQLVSGKRVSKPGDDPTAAARAERALASVARHEADQRALEASRTATTLSESALGDALELLQQAREALVGAGNGSWTSVERGYAAQTLADLRDRLLAMANRDNGAGGYLFGGQNAQQRPFAPGAGGSVVWAGSAGRQYTASGEQMPLTLDGQAVWLQAASGDGTIETGVDAAASSGGAWIDAGRVTGPNALPAGDYVITFGPGGSTYDVATSAGVPVLSNQAYASGQEIGFAGVGVTITGQPAAGDRFTVGTSAQDLSIFDALDSAIGVLRDGTAGSAQVTQAVKFGLRDADAVISHMNSVRADLGAWLNRIDNVESRIAQGKLQSETERSDAEDLDMVQALSDFQTKQSSYDAALRTYSMVQKMSLFQYLGS